MAYVFTWSWSRADSQAAGNPDDSPPRGGAAVEFQGEDGRHNIGPMDLDAQPAPRRDANLNLQEIDNGIRGFHARNVGNQYFPEQFFPRTAKQPQFHVDRYENMKLAHMGRGDHQSEVVSQFNRVADNKRFYRLYKK